MLSASKRIVATVENKRALLGEEDRFSRDFSHHALVRCCDVDCERMNNNRHLEKADNVNSYRHASNLDFAGWRAFQSWAPAKKGLCVAPQRFKGRFFSRVAESSG